MKNIFTIIFIALVMILGTLACSSSGNSNTAQNNIKYEKIDVSDAPLKLQETIEQVKKKKGYIYYTENDSDYIYVAAGEKPTGGYTVEVLDLIENKNGKLTLTVRFTEPGKNDMVTQVITYPYALIRFKAIDKPVEVIDESNDKLPQLGQ
ncbi:protease complex subunit PrcB family protein [Mahella australiensis]|uniref:PrcB C-terminal domain-containing protein n=1 Tax=Mahella australiensis (strain DSM 15567 / CIP 107919 / 50-1 BON) TaxID=697281 RepID=F4A080_MAHA5|nr:protease complex subunit PrcB family protein [Mahella australiensis]AEE96914.1 hypothetical protein Mahau_1733 [Mahella australiensis 50-1 BON]